jgi:hypothetical protein
MIAIFFFDKAVLLTVGSIGGLFLLVKGYWIEKQGLAMWLGKEGGVAAAAEQVLSKWAMLTREAVM